MAAALQLLKSPDTTYEVHPLIRTRVTDAQHGIQQMVLEYGHIQSIHRVIAHVFRPGFQAVPLSFQEHAEGPLFLR